MRFGVVSSGIYRSQEAAPCQLPSSPRRQTAARLPDLPLPCGPALTSCRPHEAIHSTWRGSAASRETAGIPRAVKGGPLRSSRPIDASHPRSPNPRDPVLPPASLFLQEAIERAYAQDVAGQRGAAAQLYRTALDILREGLAVSVPTAGLDATHSSTARWRTDMSQWQQGVLDRLRDLESLGGSAAAAGGGSSRGGGAGGRPAAAQPANPLLGRPPSLRRAAGTATAGGAAGPRGAAAAAGGGPLSRDDRDFEERVLSEVLDSAPSVAWDDVAGLSGAKQARWDRSGCLPEACVLRLTD